MQRQIGMEYVRRFAALFLFIVVFATGYVKPVLALQSDAKGETTNVDELLASQDAQTRAKGIQAVASQKITKALPKVEEMAKKDESPGIRRIACWAMGELDYKAGIPTLKEVAQKDSSENVKVAAQRALEKMGGNTKAEEPKPEPEPFEDVTPVVPVTTPPAAPTTSPQEGIASKPPEQPIASCIKDTDCKGDRICNKGVCKDIKKQPTMGWATEAAVIGFIGTAAVGGLSVYAELHPEDLLPAIPLAAGATLVTLIVAPAVKSGSKSVRDPNGVPGSLALRVVGWASFGVHLLGSAALTIAIPFHWLKRNNEGDKWTPQSSWILTNSIFGMAALVCLSTDAIIARSQAKSLIRTADKEKTESSSLEFAPFLAPVASQKGVDGAALGVTGRF